MLLEVVYNILQDLTLHGCWVYNILQGFVIKHRFVACEREKRQKKKNGEKSQNEHPVVLTKKKVENLT